MNEDVLKRLEDLPQDGKHFSIEGIMEEAIQDMAKAKTKDVDASSTTTIKANILKNGTLTTNASYISPYTTISYPAYQSQIWDIQTEPQYEIDFEQVQSMEDIKTILKKMNITFTGRNSVKGIEHLVMKK